MTSDNPFLDTPAQPFAFPASKQAALQKQSVFLAGKSAGLAIAANLLFAGKQSFGKAASVFPAPSFPSDAASGPFD